MTTAIEYRVRLKRPHAWQQAILDSIAKRRIIRAGRRGGKTIVAAIMAVRMFLENRRVLYATPTVDQLEAFWAETKRSLAEPIDAGVYLKNETWHSIEARGSKARIRAKTAWNADTLRGDYADLLILDEWQLMNELAWAEVGAPMLLDNDGDAVFIYTPPSLHSRSTSKADDPRHAAKMFKAAQQDTTGRWQTFHFSSHDNPYISQIALSEITGDMTQRAIRQEIEALDTEDVPGALWTLDMIDAGRVREAPMLTRVVIGIDPPGGATECGIVAAGVGQDGDWYILADRSLQASPDRWADAAIRLFSELQADRIVAEANYGGDMVEATIRHAAKARGQLVPVRLVNATRGKVVRAEPVAALYEQGKVHHIGFLPDLEDEMTTYVQGNSRSPNRLDAMVWAMTALVSHKGAEIKWV